jgi:hypothetical protein
MIAIAVKVLGTMLVVAGLFALAVIAFDMYKRRR